MSVKIKQSLIKCLNKIENDTFDEETIRTLLIVSRDYIRNEGLIRELAHFIAHPIRNQGIFHKKLNNRYAKLKLVEEQVNKLEKDELKGKLKTENELSDFMLGGISVEKVEAKLYEILYIDGLEDYPESHLKKYTGLNKKQVRDIFNEFYTKENGFYYLSTNKTENLIRLFKSLPKEKYNPEREIEITNQLLSLENYAKHIKQTINEIQKVIRGAIFYNSVFKTETLHKEIISSFSQILEEFCIDKHFVKIIEEKIDEILLCIMTLLHDAKFIFYDKTVARAYLCFYLENNGKYVKDENYDESNAIYESGVVALYLSDKTLSAPLYVSDLPVNKYLNRNVKNRTLKIFSEIEWITSSRIENKLYLTNTDEIQ